MRAQVDEFVRRIADARLAAIERAIAARMLLGVTPDRIEVRQTAHAFPPDAWLVVDGAAVWGLTWSRLGEFAWCMREMRPDELALPARGLDLATPPAPQSRRIPPD